MRILGISSPYHDAAACIVEDGKIICAVEEERLVRKKRALGLYPSNAIKWCLESQSLSLEDIDHVVYSWDIDRINDGILRMKSINQQLLLPHLLFENQNYIKNIEYIDHHLSHASSTFRTSGFDSAAILVVDGTGEDNGSSLYIGKEDGKIDLIQTWPAKDSLGLFYEAATQYAGFAPFEAGKFMGLAAYGKGQLLPYFSIEQDTYKMNIQPQVSYEHIVQHWIQKFKKDFGPMNKIRLSYDAPYCKTRNATTYSQNIIDFSASVQFTLEYLVKHLMQIAKTKTKEKNICLSGGVALNCSCNGKMIQEKIFDEMYIFGAANDAGTAIGAACETWHQLNGGKFERVHDLGMGPEFSHSHTKNILDKFGISYTTKEPIKKTAELIEANKIGAWFSGKVELGPRALGYRSIIANAAIESNKDVINIKIKERENWRPFAPSIARDYAEIVFGNDISMNFMMYSLPIISDHDNFKSVTHIDGTTRPQTVSPQYNPEYYNLLSEVKGKIGFPGILNTSFNIGGEPIICRPEEAIRSFYSSALDFMYMNGCLICKKN